MHKTFYTWQQLDEDKWKIAEWMNGKNFANIYGIPRGGLVVATVLSYITGLPVIFDIKDITQRTAVVDDIIDTAATVERVFYKISARPLVASIYAHRDAKIKPDFYVHVKEVWIVFPWETEESSKYDTAA